MIGQTAELVPADRKLYALRDVTATVESIPLICASIMSKKLAEGIDALVLDVKFGRGAFMKEKARARELADRHGRDRPGHGQTDARAAHADGPAARPRRRQRGRGVESIEALKGRGPADLMEVTYALGAQMLLLGRVAADPADARARLENSHRRRFRAGEVPRPRGGPGRGPGGDRRPMRLPGARFIQEVGAGDAGYVVDVDPMAVAQAALLLGAGRAKASAAVDPAVGLTDLRESRRARRTPRPPLHDHVRMMSRSWPSALPLIPPPLGSAQRPAAPARH